MSRITPEMAREELARRELAARGVNISSNTQEDDTSTNASPPQNLWQKIMRYGIKDPILGVAEAGRNVENLLSKIPGALFPYEPPRDYSHLLGVNKESPTDKLIQGIGQFAPALAAPEADLGPLTAGIKSIPKAGSLLSKIIGEAVPQAAYSATQQPEDRGASAALSGTSTIPFSVASYALGDVSPLAKTIGKIALGGGIGAAAGETARQFGASPYESTFIGLGAGLGGGKLLNRRALIEKMTAGVDPDLAAERLSAANKLGLNYLTPAEAGLSPMAARAQGAAMRNEGAHLAYESTKNRKRTQCY